MIHYEYKKARQANGSTPRRGGLNVDACWRDLMEYVQAKSAPVAALLAVQARMSLDEKLHNVTLTVHPGLFQTLMGQEAKRRVIEEAFEAVFGDGWRLALQPGTWDKSVPVGAPKEATIGSFEQLKQLTAEGQEYWSSRDLARALGYTNYRQFEPALEKAKTACLNSGHEVADHFSDAMQEAKRTTFLSRYACYMIIQNSDPAKTSVALGQTYFAVQARRQEVADQKLTAPQLSPEDQRRLMLRQEVAWHNKKLAAAAKSAGVVASDDFREFQNQGYRGLYGGRSAGMIREYKHLGDTDNILDYMGSTELAANLFRATQTEEKIRRDVVQGKEEACQMHHMVGTKVRQTMKEISGVMPEDLPVVENINEVRRRMKKLQAEAKQQRLQQA
jgi:DNA-damage-inducible protein D